MTIKQRIKLWLVQWGVISADHLLKGCTHFYVGMRGCLYRVDSKTMEMEFVRVV